MESLIDEMIAEYSGPLGELGPSVDLDEEEIEKLEALGYVMPKKSAPSGPLPDPKDMMADLNNRLDSKEIVKQARVFLNSNDLDEARWHLERAIELDPKNDVAIHDIGVIHYRRGEFEEALPYLEEAVRLSPTKPLPREHLGRIYMKLNRHGDAARELETAVALDPEKADLRIGYGMALAETGDINGALQQFYKAIELEPQLGTAYYRAAQALTTMGHLDEARKMLQEVLAMNPPPRLAEPCRRLLSDIEERRGR
jgi:tetratricopeptide (TPR) repeat protein